MKINIIGYGSFGKAAATILSNKSHEIYCLTSKKEEALKDGNRIHNKLGNSDYDIIITARKTSQDIANIIEENNITSKYIIDISTNPVEVVNQMYKYSANNDINYIELPQLGSSVSLSKGQSVSIALSSVSEMENVSTIIDTFGTSKFFVDKPLEPTKLKIMHNFLASGYLSLYKTIFASADKANMSREVLSEMLSMSPLNCKLLEAKLPKILTSSYSETQFSVDNMIKDLNLFEEIMPNSSLCKDSFSSVINIFSDASHDGLGMCDTSSVIS